MYPLYAMGIDRRTFALSMAASLYAGPLVFFTESEAALMNALLNQIVPPVDGPGAADLGVAFYIDKQLAGPLKRYAAQYRAMLPGFDQAAREADGRAFAELPFERQTALLVKIETERKPPLSGFFGLLVDHAMQGYYGSPEHGGNRDGASWKMLGIEDVMRGHIH